MSWRVNILTYAPVAVLALFVGVLYYLHPWCIDDIWHSEGWRGDLVHDVVSTISTHFYIDNGRLGNNFGILLLALPKWVSAILFGAAFMLMILLSIKIAEITKNYLYSSIIVLPYLLLLPWAHFMFTTMFAANYLVSSVVFLWVFWLFTSNKIDRWWEAALLGLLLGAWHEQFGAAMFAAVVGIVVICRHGKASKVDIGLAAGLLIGLIYLYMVPGTSVRMSNNEMLEGLRYPLRGVAQGMPYYLLIITAITVSFKHRDIWREPVFTGGISAATGAFIVWRVVSLSMQVTWLMNLMSIIALIWLAHRYIHIGKRIANIGAMVVWIAVFTHMGTSLPWFIKMDREYTQAGKLIEENPEGTVFYTLTRSTDVPTYILGKPNFNALTAWGSPFERVVPEAMCFVEHDGIYGQEIVLPYDETLARKRGDIMITATGKTFSSEYHMVPFEGAGGKKFLYVWINNRPMRSCGDFVSYECYADEQLVYRR